MVMRLDKNTIEMFEYVDKMVEANYPIDHRDCIKQAVRKFMPEYELTDIYSLYGITYNEYIEDMSKTYLTFKSNKLCETYRNLFNSELFDK